MARKKAYLREVFNKNISEEVERFVASINFDWRLYKEDIAGSIAHVEMLAKQKIISEEESKDIIKGLLEIKEEIESGKFKFSTKYEDIHLNIERRLFQKIGEVAAKLHTARSRNDQIALDLRLYLRNVLDETISKLKSLQSAIVDIAEKYINVVMPGFTHMQHAQPILFSHHMLSYFEMIQRDVERFKTCYIHTNVLPLGSGALAGVTYPIDRNYVAQKLGFPEISRNSIDAVSDRDFIIEYVVSASITMMHLSRMAEDLIIWATNEFSFVDIDESYCTSSSIMPQKKNPDVLELIRGKTGRVYGNLLSLLTVMKALPSSYNRDLQEDKEPLFDTVDTIHNIITVFTGLINNLRPKKNIMYSHIKDGYILATDIADYLVKKGLPFRQAHSIVARLVKYAISNNKPFNKLKLEEYKKFSPLFSDDVYDITIEKSVTSRDNFGGTSPNQVRNAINIARKLIVNNV